MSQESQYLKDISEIKTLMERSSRFISLSGLSGIFAGVYALIGAYIAYKILYVKEGIIDDSYQVISVPPNSVNILILVALIVLLLAISTGVYLTTRRTKKAGQKIWDQTARRLLINLMIPLATGGVLSLIILGRGIHGLVASVTLIFYGLALVNASKYTLSDIRSLGFAEIILGLIAAAYPGFGLIFWSFGFGILHILYGTIMYFKYEK